MPAPALPFICQKWKCLCEDACLFHPSSPQGLTSTSSMTHSDHMMLFCRKMERLALIPVCHGLHVINKWNQDLMERIVLVTFVHHFQLLLFYISLVKNLGLSMFCWQIVAKTVRMLFGATAYLHLHNTDLLYFTLLPKFFLAACLWKYICLSIDVQKVSQGLRQLSVSVLFSK